MVVYHTRFRNFHSGVLDATDRLFRSCPWRDTANATRADKFGLWLSRSANAYGVPVPDLLVTDDPGLALVHGCYYPGRELVVLPKYSVTTLLHEFRHHMQHHGAWMVSDDVEEDARAWSLSLFHQVRPDLFAQAAQRGDIFHLTGHSNDEFIRLDMRRRRLLRGDGNA